ncbi:RraA family protein [Nocardia sp. NPDC059246]|uniref:RraA family protein n=1 Tax=unclassified Nocardia TaxID=2637762 RepID=UPI0036AF5F0B
MTALTPWEKLSSAQVSDAMNRFQVIDPSLRPVSGTKLLGRAWTARTMAAENSTVTKAIETAPPGSVLVVDAGGYAGRAIWGSINTAKAIARGLTGCVLDGAVRDIEAIRQFGFPLFARGLSAAGPNKGWDGDVGGTISCGGVTVHAGDLVLADLDGIVVVPQELEDDVLVAATQLHTEDHRKLAQALGRTN